MPPAPPEAAQTLRPGERLVAGKPYIFDHAALNLHLAREAIASAPANLSALGDDELRGLRSSAAKVDYADRLGFGPLQARIKAEYAARGWDSGSAVNAAAQASAPAKAA